MTVVKKPVRAEIFKDENGEWCALFKRNGRYYSSLYFGSFAQTWEKVGQLMDDYYTDAPLA